MPTRNVTQSRRAPASTVPAAPKSTPAPAIARAPGRRRRNVVTVDSLPAPAPLVHTVAEVQSMLRCARNTVYRLVSAGKLEMVSLTGDASRITAASLTAMLAAAPRTSIREDPPTPAVRRLRSGA
jgi:hypothetical protein